MNELKFRVGSMDYRVKEVPELSRRYDLFGQILYADGSIEIDAGLSGERTRNVLIHELLHAMLYEAGYEEQDEDQVIRLGNVLAQVLRDNDFGFMREGEAN